MNKLFILLAALMVCSLPIRFSSMERKVSHEELIPEFIQLYHEMQLEDIIDIKAFEQALAGYNKIDTKNKELITLIDYSKPPTEERLFVVDLKEKKLLYTSHVLHGRNSGYELATSFSNEMGSNKSSLGFFLTEETYKGKYGYSLIIDGLEKGINDMAKDRAIVIHGSKYANPTVINKAKRIPRSLGCPAIPYGINEDIIDAIKGGSIVFIYADDEEYIKNSNLLDPNRLIS